MSLFFKTVYIHTKYTNETSTNRYFVIQFQVNSGALWLLVRQAQNSVIVLSDLLLQYHLHWNYWSLCSCNVSDVFAYSPFSITTEAFSINNTFTWSVFIAVVPRCHAFLLTVFLEGESDEVYSRGKGPGSHCAASERHSWSSADRATSQVSDATYSHMFSHLYSFMYTILGMLLDISSCFFFLLSPFYQFYHCFITVLSRFYHCFIIVS